MSYILDALKKSERQRPPGPVPDLFTVQGPQPPERRCVPVGAILGALGVVAVAGLVAWAWLGERRPADDARQEAASTASPAVETPEPAREPEPEPSRAPSPAPSRTKAAPVPRPAARPALPAAAPPVQTPAPAVQPAVQPVAAPAAPPGKPAAMVPAPAVPVAPPSAPAAPASAPAQPSPASPTPVAPVETPPPPAGVAPVPAGGLPAAAPAPAPEPVPPADGRVVRVDELPASVRALAETVAINGIVWSEEPTLRMVTVRDRIVREGQEAAPGVRLDEITQEGAVFNAGGWRFRLAGF